MEELVADVTRSSVLCKSLCSQHPTLHPNIHIIPRGIDLFIKRCAQCIAYGCGCLCLPVCMRGCVCQPAC